MLLTHQIWDSPNLVDRGDKRYTHGSIKLLRWLLKGIHKEFAMDSNIPDGDIDITDEKVTPEEILPKFRHHLRKHIETQTLPYFLKLIGKWDQTREGTDSLPKPPLSYLLDLPGKEAVQKFSDIHFSYNLKRGKIEITHKSVKQRVARIRERGKKENK